MIGICDGTWHPAPDAHGLQTSQNASTPRGDLGAPVRRLVLNLIIGLMLAAAAAAAPSWAVDLFASSTYSVEKSEGEETATLLVAKHRRTRSQSENRPARETLPARHSGLQTPLCIAHRSDPVAADSLTGRERLVRLQRFLT